MLSKKVIFALIVLASYGIAVNMVSCTHEDEVLGDIIGTTYTYGDDVVNESDGYVFDHTHSSVRWETAYLGAAALLTGRFNDFVLSIEFDENNPENTKLSGSVILSSVNTGEPGRDGGCLLGTFGTSVSDSASFVSTSVEKDGNGGYVVKGDFTFHGFTNEITGKLTYSGITLFDVDSGVSGAPFNIAGFVMEFDINAKSAFGIQSSSISDRVGIICSGQFKKGL